MDIDAASLHADILNACRQVYGDRLVSLAIFGSWARGEATPVSDLDLLVVADPLPDGRMKRVREFRPVEAATAPARSRVWPEASEPIRLSPVFKTPIELAAGSPLYLDMTLWRILLLDRGDVLAGYLAGLAERMRRLGSRRETFKGGVYWDYKPDFKPGEVVEL